MGSNSLRVGAHLGRRREGRRAFILALACAACLLAQAGAVFAQRTRAPRRRAPAAAGGLALSNRFIAAAWRAEGARLRAAGAEDRVNVRALPLGEHAFTLVLRDGSEIKAGEMRVVGAPRAEVLRAEPRASRLAERLPGRQLSVTLEDERGRVRASWRAELREGSNYVRQEVTFEALGSDLPVAEIRLVDAALGGARVEGTVTGSPVVAGNVFIGFEHPLSVCEAGPGRATCGLRRELPLRAGAGVTYSSVVGVTRPGQLRRDFLAYLERERAHPYRTFLHYNSWYDIGYTNKFDEKDSLDRINHFGRELVEKRGVRMNSFLFDDGWDDTSSLWSFHAGFPRGLTPLREAAARYGAAPGVWMSPWGGYDEAKEARLRYGRAQGFEIRDDGGKFGPGFALSGPKYYERFRDVCVQMIDRYGVNQFKIDGFGNADRAFPGSRFDSDFDAAISLVRELRARRPDLFVNLTVGTFPSPFWLRYGDSIWRGGEDHDFAGTGSDRQQWITYRDAETYKMTVRRGPLYPLNSLMLHGLVYAEKVSRSKRKKLDRDPRGDFDDEVKSYFGSGTHLQEMYVTPALLSEKDWDLLAEAARWSRSNADVLVDTHWVGGDPGALEVYGWASWSPRKGILVLRNPSDRAQAFTLDVGRAFELPEGAPRAYAARSPWRDESGRPAVRLHAGRPHTFRLAPFEVLTLEAAPAR
ncbi:MAG TPA: enterotoxin [Pyrinomonadaceae bacterium]|nr:enterotoxin [Pyrinomonadaceae bacterium]